MEDFNHLEGNERLKAENEFLKMKLMLEQGARFGGNEDDALPEEIENQFLNNIIAFEQQFTEHKTIKVYDRIGRPTHFKPASEIADQDIKAVWDQLSTYLNKHGIDLSVCSPNISVRELYRFAVEELFEHEMDDIDIPGWTTNFIYDEFYPDPVYDNSGLVEQNLFRAIFRKDDLFYDIHYANDGFTFNGLYYDDFKIYRERINRFKSIFDEIEISEFNVENCVVQENNCEIRGQYKAVARQQGNETTFAGSYEVKLVISELGYWDMKTIQISGFNPA